jgi:AraC-like DNA-binding protein/mannose-6-phosphate isomerase-like protein (cupin superfamily)
MKPKLEHITEKKGRHAFWAFEVKMPRFDFFWHYHPEYELTLIVEGRGRRLVGDSHENFEQGDWVLMGPELPHTWVSDGSQQDTMVAVVVQFPAQFVARFTDLEELSAINKLLVQARRGIAFIGEKPASLMEHMKRLPQKSGVEKMISLLHILGELTQISHKSLASPGYQPLRGNENENRINKVCQYVQKHAATQLSIQEAASLIHLSPGAFCKFFKRITGKTFSDYVNDIRIAQVCKQLMTTDKQIAEIAYENGFETLTYFNRVFLKKTGVQPRQYREGKL